MGVVLLSTGLISRVKLRLDTGTLGQSRRRSLYVAEGC